MKVVKSFREFIRESIWSDIQDRNSGEVTRKEDNINLLDIDVFFDYLINHYDTTYPKNSLDNINLQLMGYLDSPGIEDLIYMNILHFSDVPELHITNYKLRFTSSQLYRKMCKKFHLEKVSNRIYTDIQVTPKEGEFNNSFIIEVIEFIIDNMDEAFTPKIQRKESIKESIWSDIQDRNAREVARKEDVMHNKEELIDRIANEYEIQNTSKTHILDLTMLDVSLVNDMRDLFSCDVFDEMFIKMKTLNISNWDVSNVKDMGNMFYNCRNLQTLDVSKWNTSHVEDMTSMFFNCKSLTALDVSNWDVSNVNDMMGMFDSCESLTTLDVSNWDVSNVKHMGYMFDGCKSLTSLNVSKWNMSNMMFVEGMFDDCKSLTELDVSKWNMSNVDDMEGMFCNCKSLTKLDVSKWDVSNAQKMISMFDGCISLTELDVSKWNVSNVMFMDNMFLNCKSIEILDVSNWNVSKVRNMNNMFNGCISLTKLDITKWDEKHQSKIQVPEHLREVNESLWSDIQDRNSGEVVRKEDDVNLMDSRTFYDYLQKNYKDKVYDISQEDFDTVHHIYVEVTKEIFVHIKYRTPEGGLQNIDRILIGEPQTIQSEKIVSSLYRQFDVAPPMKSYTREIAKKDDSELTNQTVLDIVDILLKKIKSNQKKTMNESVWSDIQDRNSGEVVRKEDDVNLLNDMAFTEYLKDTYTVNDPITSCEIYIDGAGEITLPVFEYNMGTRSVEFMYYTPKEKKVLIGEQFCYWDDKLMDKIKKTYKTSEITVRYSNYIQIYPKKGEINNSFFLELLDFVLENANIFYHRLLVKNIKESVWSDIQDRNSGEVVRKEDDVNLLDKEGLYKYILSHYEVTVNDDEIAYGTENMHLPVLKHHNSIRALLLCYGFGEIHCFFNLEIFKSLYDTLHKKYVITTRSKHHYVIEPENFKADNQFFLDVIDIFMSDKKSILRKKVNESLWSDIQDRNSGEVVRKEDTSNVIEIDGVKYIFLNDFWNLGDVYEEENSNKWTCFAFNKPKSGNVIKGDTDDTGVFGWDKWDIGEEEYDVYVLREYIDVDRDDYIQQLIHNGHFEQMYGEFSEIQDILVKYTKKIFEDNHMSEFAYYTIYEMIGQDWDFGGAIYFADGKMLFGEKRELPCDVDFEHGEVDDVHQIDFPMLDNWYEDLKKELIEAYKKIGWVYLENHKLDPDNNPNNTDSVAFAKFKD